jgi:nucleoid-associated protein YgaU
MIAAKGASAITVQPGYTLWAIAREKYGSGFQYVRVYQANQDLIKNPDLIYPGQVFKLPEE